MEWDGGLWWGFWTMWPRTSVRDGGRAAAVTSAHTWMSDLLPLCSSRHKQHLSLKSLVAKSRNITLINVDKWHIYSRTGQGTEAPPHRNKGRATGIRTPSHPHLPISASQCFSLLVNFDHFPETFISSWVHGHQQSLLSNLYDIFSSTPREESEFPYLGYEPLLTVHGPLSFVVPWSCVHPTK